MTHARRRARRALALGLLALLLTTPAAQADPETAEAPEAPTLGATAAEAGLRPANWKVPLVGGGILLIAVGALWVARRERET